MRPLSLDAAAADQLCSNSSPVLQLGKTGLAPIWSVITAEFFIVVRAAAKPCMRLPRPALLLAYLTSKRVQVHVMGSFQV